MEKKFSNIKERVLYFAKNQGFSVEYFLSSIEMTYGSFKGKAKEGSLNSDAIAKILTNYPNINIEWLLTGKGDMIKFSNENIDKPTVFNLKSDRLIKHQSVPLYNIEASAGIVTLFSDSAGGKPIDHIQIPNLPKCDGAVYVSGDSMYPLLKSGDIVMYKQVHNVQDGLFWGEMYLISIDLDGDEIVSVKYIQKSAKGEDFIKLVSQNQHHQDREIHISKIRALALVKASIRINSMS